MWYLDEDAVWLLEQSRTVDDMATIVRSHRSKLHRLQELTAFLPSNARIRQRLWHIEHQTDKRPPCAVCGKEVNWNNAEQKYQRYCGVKCMHIGGVAREKSTRSLLTTIKSKHETIAAEVEANLQHYTLTADQYASLLSMNLTSWANTHPHHKEAVIKLTQFLSAKAPLRQRVWHLAHQDYHLRRCDGGCGTVVEWCPSRNVYNRFCGPKCSTASAVVSSRKRDTVRSRYGVDNIFSNVEYIKKARVKALGVEHALQSPTIVEKMKQTNLERYGATSILCTEKHITYRQKCVDNIGWAEVCRRISATKQARKSRATWCSAFGSHLPDPASTYDRLNDPIWLREINQSYNLVDIANMLGVRQPTVTKAFQRHGIAVAHNKSAPQNAIEMFVRSIVGDQEVESNTKRVITPYEIDIYVPNRNIAIEFNGIFWHGEVNGRKPKQYHANKTQMCADKGIRLLHIFEHEWANSQSIVESKLRVVFGCVSEKFHARTCEVVPLSWQDAAPLLDKWHMQGAGPRGECVGLLHCGTVVSVLTFGKDRFSGESRFEIYRYASAPNTVVVGGFSRLMKRMVQTSGAIEVISYADLRWSTVDGSVYQRSGFVYTGSTEPNYYYFQPRYPTKLYSRIKFQKHKLPGLLENFDPSKTEWENMQDHGFDRIWDCGHARWVWKANQ